MNTISWTWPCVYRHLKDTAEYLEKVGRVDGAILLSWNQESLEKQVVKRYCFIFFLDSSKLIFNIASSWLVRRINTMRVIALSYVFSSFLVIISCVSVIHQTNISQIHLQIWLVSFCCEEIMCQSISIYAFWCWKLSSREKLIIKYFKWNSSRLNNIRS